MGAAPACGASDACCSMTGAGAGADGDGAGTGTPAITGHERYDKETETTRQRWKGQHTRVALM